MWFSGKNTAPVLTQELVERTWDLSGRLKQLESTLNERLDELSKRYRRAEQSEKRLDDKNAKGGGGCEDETPRVHPALAARYRRREAQINRLGGKV